MIPKSVTNPSAPALAQANHVRDVNLTAGSGILGVICLTALAAVLRTLYLSSKSLSLDEGFSAFLARTSVAEFTHRLWTSELNMALYYGLLRLWVHLGSSEFTIRLMSIAFGVATVPVIYFLGLRLFNRRTAIVATLLIALHPAHVALAQDARSYSLAVLLVSLSSLLFLRTLQNPTFPNWSGYAIVAALAVYAHFFAVLVMLSQALSLVVAKLDRPAWNAFLKASLLLAVLLAPVAVSLSRLPRLELAWVPSLHPQQVVGVLYFLTLSKIRCLTYVLFWIAAIAGVLMQPGTRASKWPFWFVLSWLIVPVAVTVAMSFARPLLIERFLAVCIPASVLLAAAGFELLLARFRILAAVAMLLLVLYSARSLRFFYVHPEIKDDWRGATAHVLAQSRPGDEVIVLPEYARFTVDYYRETRGPTAPGLHLASSATSDLGSRSPQAVWFIGSDFPRQGASEAEVDGFLVAHPEYCEVSVSHFTAVRVWQMQRCVR